MGKRVRGLIDLTCFLLDLACRCLSNTHTKKKTKKLPATQASVFCYTLQYNLIIGLPFKNADSKIKALLQKKTSFTGWQWGTEFLSSLSFWREKKRLQFSIWCNFKEIVALTFRCQLRDIKDTVVNFKHLSTWFPFSVLDDTRFTSVQRLVVLCPRLSSMSKCHWNEFIQL